MSPDWEIKDDAHLQLLDQATELIARADSISKSTLVKGLSVNASEAESLLRCLEHYGVVGRENSRGRRQVISRRGLDKATLIYKDGEDHPLFYKAVDIATRMNGRGNLFVALESELGIHPLNLPIWNALEKRGLFWDSESSASKNPANLVEERKRLPDPGFNPANVSLRAAVVWLLVGAIMLATVYAIAPTIF